VSTVAGVVLSPVVVSVSAATASASASGSEVTAGASSASSPGSLVIVASEARSEASLLCDGAAGASSVLWVSCIGAAYASLAPEWLRCRANNFSNYVGHGTERVQVSEKSKQARNKGTTRWRTCWPGDGGIGPRALLSPARFPPPTGSIRICLCRSF
jgi:hypothetical protein